MLRACTTRVRKVAYIFYAFSHCLLARWNPFQIRVFKQRMLQLLLHRDADWTGARQWMLFVRDVLLNKRLKLCKVGRSTPANRVVLLLE